MTRIEGHPPAANHGPVIFLPPAYDGFGAFFEGLDDCRDCDDLGNMCPDCIEDLADSEAERWADGRRDGDE